MDEWSGSYGFCITWKVEKATNKIFAFHSKEKHVNSGNQNITMSLHVLSTSRTMNFYSFNGGWDNWRLGSFNKTVDIRF